MTAMPKGACDSHVHVFDPDRFAYAPGRAYTPGPAPVADLRAHLAGLGLARCVVVQPSVQGTDNGCLLAALDALGPQVARGVAVIDPQGVTDAELARLHAAGVRALRVNFASGGAGPADRLAAIRATAGRIAGSGMAVQIYADVATAAQAVQAIRDVPLILDHYAGFRVGVDSAGPAFGAILRALAAGNLWVKLSAPYRADGTGPGHAELRAAAQAMIAAAPDRMVWASDWPHTGGGADRARRGAAAIEPFRQIDDAADLRRLAEWVGDDARLAAILSTNPAALFGFPAIS